MQTLALYQRLQAQAVASRMYPGKLTITLIDATTRSGISESSENRPTSGGLTTCEPRPPPVASLASIWPVACDEALTEEMCV